MCGLLRLRLLLAEDAAYSSVAFCRANGIDWEATAAACGGVFLALIIPDGRTFDLAHPDDPDAVEAAVVDAIVEDGETVEDLVAWPVAEPGRVMTACGVATALGREAAANPATYFAGQPLRLFRTPLAWLQAGCIGACPFDMRGAARWLRDIDGPFLAEDDLHAAEIARALRAVSGLDRLVVPRRRAMA